MAEMGTQMLFRKTFELAGLSALVYVDSWVFAHLSASPLVHTCPAIGPCRQTAGLSSPFSLLALILIPITFFAIFIVARSLLESMGKISAPELVPKDALHLEKMFGGVFGLHEMVAPIEIV